MDKKSREILYITLAGVQDVSSEIAIGSNTALRGSGVWKPTKPGLVFALFVRPQGTRTLEGSATRRRYSPSREVAAAIPRSREGAATHAGVDRRWHAVCDTEGIDERHTGARLHGGTRDPRRGVTEGQSSVSPASGNCSGTRGTSARHTGARAVFPGFKPLNLGTMSTLSVDVERVTLNGVTSSVRRSCPRPFSQKPRSNVPTAPQSGILSFSVSINT